MIIVDSELLRLGTIITGSDKMSESPTRLHLFSIITLHTEEVAPWNLVVTALPLLVTVMPNRLCIHTLPRLKYLSQP